MGWIKIITSKSSLFEVTIAGHPMQADTNTCQAHNAQTGHEVQI